MRAVNSGFENKLNVLYEDEVSQDYSYIPKKEDQIGLVRMAAREVDDGKSDVRIGEPLPNDGVYEESVKEYINGLKQSEHPSYSYRKKNAERKAENSKPVRHREPERRGESVQRGDNIYVEEPVERMELSSGTLEDIDSEKTSMLGVEENDCYLKSVNTGETFYIMSNPFVIGRKHDSDLCIAERVISGHHAEISELSGRMFLTDLGSTNGTLVDGQKIPKQSMVELHNGTEVIFANKKFKFFM